jgi:GNAT superfamily N-acetyltransferase
MCRVDYVNSFALLAEDPGGPGIIAIARCCRTGATNAAEVAIVTADRYQGRGLGVRMLRRLAEIAAAHGIDTFEADVLVDNDRALATFRRTGFPITTQTRDGVRHLTFPIVPP